MPSHTFSTEEIAALVRRAGFTLTPEQVAEYVEAYGYIAEMAARIRDDRSYMAEPAHIFTCRAEARS
jgi:hypothetical protein